ncbi:MAG: hypothetical protein K8U03_05035 [Planctomycetia bacterium]|nr:hypothetical protein [Planctomycetia bacterium]
MFTGSQIVDAFTTLGITHVVWLPDSTLGTWDADIAASTRFQMVRVCREGEAWAVAVGLHLGGARPMVVMQSTGLFESGDSLRNALFDLHLPLRALIGYRSFLLKNSTDSARAFAEPILKAWGIDYLLTQPPEGPEAIVEHWKTCAERRTPGFVLMAEGKG